MREELTYLEEELKATELNANLISVKLKEYNELFATKLVDFLKTKFENRPDIGEMISCDISFHRYFSDKELWVEVCFKEKENEHEVFASDFTLRYEFGAKRLGINFGTCGTINKEENPILIARLQLMGYVMDNDQLIIDILSKYDPTLDNLNYDKWEDYRELKRKIEAKKYQIDREEVISRLQPGDIFKECNTSNLIKIVKVTSRNIIYNRGHINEYDDNGMTFYNVINNRIPLDSFVRDVRKSYYVLYDVNKQEQESE